MDINSLKLKENIIDIIFPVGSYYETSNNDFDPNVEWHGTWELDSQGCVTVSQDTGTFKTLGVTVGSETKTLAVGNLPSHSHTFTGTAHYHSLNGHTHSFSATTNTPTLTGNLRTICYSGHAGTGIISSGANSKDVQLTIKTNSSYGATTYTVDASHSHSVSGTTGANYDNTANATAAGTIGNTGSGTAFSIVQKSIVVKRWHRVA